MCAKCPSLGRAPFVEGGDVPIMDRLARGGCVAFSFRSVRSLICALTICVGLFIRVDDRSLCAETIRGRVHRERGTLGEGR